MIEQLKQIRDFIEVIQSINPSICQLPPRILLDAADTHVIISDLIEQLENNEPIGRIIEDRTHHLVEILGYCKYMYGLPIKGRTNLYTHPVPLQELSNELINKLAESYTVGDQFEANLAFDRIGFARAIEAHLKGNIDATTT